MKCVQCARELDLDEKIKAGVCSPCRSPKTIHLIVQAFREQRELAKVGVQWEPGVDLETVVRQTIFKALEFFHGNRTHTARALGISIRTLRNRLRLYREGGHIFGDRRPGRQAESQL